MCLIKIYNTTISGGGEGNVWGWATLHDGRVVFAPSTEPVTPASTPQSWGNMRPDEHELDEHELEAIGLAGPMSGGLDERQRPPTCR